MSMTKTAASYSGSEDTSFSISFSGLKTKLGADSGTTAFQITSIGSGTITCGGLTVRTVNGVMQYSTDGTNYSSVTSLWYTSTGITVVSASGTAAYTGTLSWVPPADASGAFTGFSVTSATGVNGTTSGAASINMAVTGVQDAPTGSVTINGTVLEGQTLTASNTLADADGMGTVTYTWQVSSDNGTTWTSAGTGTSHALLSSEVGKLLRVTASYVDGLNKAESVSSASQTVANLNDAPVGKPTISGTVTQGQVLSASMAGVTDADGMTTATASSAFTYQWQQYDGSSWSNITGANSSTYTLAQGQVGKTVRVQVSFTDDYGTVETVTSNASASIANINDVATGQLALTSSSPAQGTALTASVGTVADADGLGTLSYQWQSSVDGTTWTDVSGATSASFSPAEAQVGQYLRAKATFTDALGGSETVYSAQTAAVSNVNDSPTGTVTISGTATQNQVLTANTSSLADADILLGTRV